MFWKNKKVLVTVGAGFIGTNLILRLLEEGAEVRATLHHKPAQIDDERVDWITCDLQQPDDCARVCRDREYVFLCAAVTSGAAVMEHTPLAHLTPNLVMNARMLEAAYAAGVARTLFISTNTVYPVTDHPVREDDVDNTFFDKYFIVAWMKRFSEIMCEMYTDHIKRPMQTVVVRPGNVYGPYDDFEWETSHVLPAFVRRVVERHDPISVWGDGKDVKDFIYVEDLVEGLLLAMQRMPDSFEPVNLAGGQGYCLRDLLQLMCELDGYADAQVEFDASKPSMIPKRLIDPTKAEQLLGFRATTPIDSGLKKTLDWYRQAHQ